MPWCLLINYYKDDIYFMFSLGGQARFKRERDIR